MATPITCPYCRVALEMPDSLVGEAVKCGGCKAHFLAQNGGEPLVPKEDAPLLEFASPPDPEDYDQPDQSAPRRPHAIPRRYRDDADDSVDIRRPPQRTSALSIYLRIRMIVFLAVLGIMVLGVFGVLAFLLIGVFILKLSGPPAGLPPPASTKLISPEGRFTVDMAGEWEEKTTHSDELNADVHLFKTRIHGGDIILAVLYYDTNVDIGDEQAFFEAYRATILDEYPRGKMIDNHRVLSRDGHNGDEYTMDVDKNHVRRRIFLDKQRIYKITEASSRLDANSPEAKRLFDSFEITK